MSFENLIATDHLDLLARVRTFLESTISPVGERWVIERYSGYDTLELSSELGSYEAFHAFDGDNATEWRTAVGQATPSQIGCGFVTAVDIRRFEIEAPDPAFGGDASMAPNTFNLEWSDNGSTWTVLETFIGQVFGNGQTIVYSVSEPSPGARLYWRLNVTANNGHADHTAVARLELQTDEGGAWLNRAEEVQLIARGPGLAAADEIYIGIQVYSLPTSDIYNWRLTTMTGYVPGNTFANQPGQPPSAAGYPLWNLATEYWLVANGQRLALVSKVETVYMTAYLGKILPYATPGQWPYPVAVLGMLPSDDLVRYSDLSLTGPWENSSGRLRIRQPGGTWLEPELWPWANVLTLRDTPGGYSLIPIQLTDTDGVYGELDGISHVSGFGNSVESTVDVGGTDHLVVQDVYRTGIRDYHALRLS